MKQDEMPLFFRHSGPPAAHAAGIAGAARAGSRRQNRAATARLATPARRNWPGMLTPAATSAIVRIADSTIAAALITLLAPIVRARRRSSLAVCNSAESGTIK